MLTSTFHITLHSKMGEILTDGKLGLMPNRQYHRLLETSEWIAKSVNISPIKKLRYTALKYVYCN